MHDSFNPRDRAFANAYKPIRLACAYLRMSSDDQKNSIDIQRKRITERAQAEGFKIIAWYEDEGRSASRETEKREAWHRLLCDAATAEWTHILVYTQDRFCRLDTFEGGQAVQKLREHEKILYTLLDGEFDWNSPFGRLSYAWKSEQSNQYSHKLAQVVVDGKIQAFKKGRQRGYVPYGYARRVVDPKGNVTELKRTERFRLPDEDWSQELIPGDPAEIEIVKWLFHTYATQDVGRRALAKELNIRKVPSPAGRLWCAVGVYHLLRNEAYVGDVRFGKNKDGCFATTCGDQMTTAVRSDEVKADRGILRQGNHEAIIDRDVWNLVQVKLDRRKGEKCRRPRGSGGFALTGVLYCGHCGRTLGGRGNKSEKGKGGVTYVCRSGFDFGEGCGCGIWRVKEAEILPLIISRLADEIDLRVLEAKVPRPPTADRPTAQDRIAQFKQAVEKLDRRLKDAVDRMFEYEEELRRPIKERIKVWEAERQQLVLQIEQASQEGPRLEETMAEWQRWFSAAKSELVHVQTSPDHGAEFEDGVKLTTESFREALQRYGCRVYIWWSRATGSRCYNVDRARILLGCPPAGRGTPPCPTDPRDGSTRLDNQIDTNETGIGFRVPFVSGIIDLEIPGSDVRPRRLDELAAKVQELRADGLTAEEVLAYLRKTGQKTGKGNEWNVQRVYSLFRTAKKNCGPAEPSTSVCDQQALSA